MTLLETTDRMSVAGTDEGVSVEIVKSAERTMALAHGKARIAQDGKAKAARSVMLAGARTGAAGSSERMA